MKITAFLLTVFFLNVYASGRAQSVTLAGKNMHLKKVFSAIRQQTGYHVFFESDLMDASRKVSFNATNMPLHSFLELVLKDQPLGYEITSKTISIIPKGRPVKAMLVAGMDLMEEQPVTIPLVTGTITDYKGEPVSNASVRVKGTTLGAMTNSKGYFSLDNLPDNAVLIISSLGYKPIAVGIKTTSGGYTAYTLAKPQEDDLKYSSSAGIVLKIKMQPAIEELEKAVITSRRAAGAPVELTHRRHQTLSQVLEGSVPGLTLKTDIKTEVDMVYKGAPLRDLYDRFVRMGIDVAAQGYPTYEDYLKYFHDMAHTTAMPGGSSIPTDNHSFTNTITNNGIVPELRGASGFGGSTSGMLVVIDGFPQDNFPADYPMNNVESVRIVRDPAECIKWGPKAAGGIIMITTTGAQPGKMQINYSFNTYFAPKPDNSNGALHLASTKDVLDYYKEAYDKGLANYVEAPNMNNLTPAQRMLYALKKGTITSGVFQQQWDSLSLLSNRDQLQLLQQNVFSHNHTLSLAGGSQAYRFNVSGTYRNAMSNAKGSKSEDFILNLKNDWRLLKGKLRAQIDLNANFNKSLNPGSPNVGFMDPYEMLIGPDGNYVYSQYEVSPELNNTMQSLGFYNYGMNALEDLHNSHTRNRTSGANSRFNMAWDLTKNLQWSANVQYNPNRFTADYWEGMGASSQRKRINDHGLFRNATSGNVVDFYVPPGDMLRRSRIDTDIWNARTGLSFRKKLAGKHLLVASAGVGAGSETRTTTPDTTYYGYNTTTGTGLPILHTGQTSFVNYLGRSVYPSELLLRGLGAESKVRNANLNANVAYTFNDRYEISSGYGAVFMPVTGGNGDYAQLTDYVASGTWLVHHENFLNIPWISTLKVKADYEVISLPQLPPSVVMSRSQQPQWNTAAIFVSSYLPAQMNGQTSTNAGGQVQASFSGDRLFLTMRYNKPSQGKSQWSGNLSWDVTKERFFKSRTISSMMLDLTVADINPYQGIALMMSTNAPREGGGYSNVSITNFEVLPQYQRNKEAHVRLGLLKDRLLMDMIYYHNIRTGLTNGNIPTDPSTGLSAQYNYSEMLNRGVELQVVGRIIENKNFSWTSTINGAYNTNEVLNAPHVNYSANRSYLTSIHDGYATDNLWSYRWAGLDNQGNPQIFNGKGEKIATPDSTSLVYSGRLRAPWTGALIQNLEYKNFFLSARAMFNLGHVFRSYMPAASGSLDKNELIAKRWRQPGDEAFTDVPAMTNGSTSRNLIIQNSTNTIESADNIRLREIQLGYMFPAAMLKKASIKGLTVSMQLQNVALWTRNKYNIDPTSVTDNGLVGIRQPLQYMLSVNVNL
ncbi:carboxypeptidase-like regulatory domain-containing protein [Chitinophaga horti]|uniref:Carboxypeptidase-like regulatory domain-containing protein n=1 Tax=Chitinophaga horti TaxID=2920382 RepID=A0ABY6J2E6_9BACT|nr:SusC/RagA family TonB-linked outer membrane protein [Chitinophaga horti]UYQ93822.1 carboxypeptidase-like regulatory domain-containing protein [Chitinophaga horti]